MDYYTSHQPQSRTIVLLHFHDHVRLCQSRIALLQRFNPDLGIYGLFGGEPAQLEHARTLEAYGVAHLYTNPNRSPAWNKKNTDLAVVDWFRDFGGTLQFDRVHVVQWDLVFFAA